MTYKTSVNNQLVAELSTNNISSQVALQYGRIYAIQDNKYSVTTLDESWSLPLAASCVLQPAIGDVVLFTVLYNQANHSENGIPDAKCSDGYILSVLQRADEIASAQLNLPAKSHVEINTLSIQAAVLSTQGQSSLSVWQEQTEITQNYQQFSKNINIRTDNRNTKINQHDEFKANSQRLVIARDWRVRAQDTDIRATRQASLDGKQVRLG